MPAPIVDDLLDMFPFTVTVTPITRNNFGERVEGTPFDVSAMISGKTQQVQTQRGLLTSDVEVIVAGDFGLSAKDHLFTLPASFNPRVKLEAMHVQTDSDENGRHHQTVFF